MAEISWDAVKQTRVSINVRRRGQCAVSRTSGIVVTDVKDVARPMVKYLIVLFAGLMLLVFVPVFVR